MRRPIVGWHKTDPAPDHEFNHYLNSRHGELYYEDLNLAELFQPNTKDQYRMDSPLEIVYLPMIRKKINTMRTIFDQAVDRVGYSGSFRYAYASKANAAEEVVRTALETGIDYEMSSWMDVEILKVQIAQGRLKPEQRVLCNGFKYPDSEYLRNIVEIKHEHDQIVPILEDLEELGALIDSRVPFQLGLRQKCYGSHYSQDDMNAANSRFGMSVEDIFKAADRIDAANNLTLSIYHAMVGSQIVDPEDFVERLTPPMQVYAQLKQDHPSLGAFDFGGGIPIAMTLDFNFDYQYFAELLLQRMLEICQAHQVDAPDIIGELGRYTVTEHGAHLFKIVGVKENNSPYPWYLIDGSIMSSFPDSWALGEHFIVLPLNHLDQPFQRVRLGGLTCDSDDIYPPTKSDADLYLPVESDNLHVGFFAIGAYQEMLGGAGGSKHCVIPEADELIIDRDQDGEYLFDIIHGQGPQQVLDNLGYRQRG
ncbi:MAG: hypothetical protein PVF49_07565 [Anaerolineales bacterium]|jgi:arginine decarboxylase